MKLFKMGLIVVLILTLTGLANAATLDDVKARGHILAGVNGGVFGFSMPNEKGEWEGLDVDTAKAMAAAVFGDASKVKFSALTAVQRLPALQSKEIDVLCRNTTQTLTRETTSGLNFVQVNYYDGQGFLVPKKLGIKSAKEMDGATVCVLPGTTTELNAADYFRTNGLMETRCHRTDRRIKQSLFRRPLRCTHLRHQPIGCPAQCRSQSGGLHALAGSDL